MPLCSFVANNVFDSSIENEKPKLMLLLACAHARRCRRIRRLPTAGRLPPSVRAWLSA